MSSDVQSLIFERERWTEARAGDWAREHGYKVGRPEHTERFIRFRQHDPDGGRFRTIPFGADIGIKAILRWPSEDVVEAAAAVGDYLEQTELWTP